MGKENKEQFERVYESESDSIFRFCLIKTSDREVAFDLAQDTFMRFWNTISKGETQIKNHRAFLFTIARNLIIDWYRKKKTQSLESVEEVMGSLDSVVSFDDQIEIKAEARFVVEKISSLEPIYRDAVYLRFVEGLGPKDIAEIVGESANVVSARITRGMQMLRLKLENNDKN